MPEDRETTAGRPQDARGGAVAAPTRGEAGAPRPAAGMREGGPLAGAAAAAAGAGAAGMRADDAARRRDRIDRLLSGTFDAILRVEENSFDNRLMRGLTITEVHTIVAMGLYERNPMNVVAARLGVTLATLTTAVNKLVAKGFVERTRAEDDRRKVMVSLTKRGRQVLRAHGLFHRQMMEGALADLTEEEERAFAAGLAKVKRFFDEQA